MRPLLGKGQALFASIKPYLKWAVLGGTFFFVVSTLRNHWQEVIAIEIQQSGLACLAIATGVTLLSHIWSGWVWSWILRDFDQPVSGVWSVRVYLKTNIAKYLPGNVWHYYGRISSAKTAGIPLSISAFSVLLEPLLMATAALLIGLCSYFTYVGIWILVLPFVLLGLHPKVINFCLQHSKSLGKKLTQGYLTPSAPVWLQRYPWRPLIGELGFVSLRSTGFLLTFAALHPIDLNQIPLLVSAFSLAWLLGLVVPGAPGGLGVFEATAISLLNQQLSAGLLLGIVASYRLVSIIAEVGGAGLAWLDEQWTAD